MDIGTGLLAFGQGIAGGLNQYHQEHQQYDQALAFADALSRIGYDPQQNKIVPIGEDTKGIDPIVNPKVLEQFTANTKNDWHRSLGGVEALTRIGVNVLQNQIKQDPLADRERIARANEANARAAALYSGASGRAGAVSSIAGKVPMKVGDQTIYVTGNEAVRLNKQDISNQVRDKYGLSTDELTDSSQHYGVKPVIDATTKKITGWQADPQGSYVMIGGDSFTQPSPDNSKVNLTYRTNGVPIPRDELTVLQRRLKLKESDFSAGATPGPAAATGAALPPAPAGKVYMRNPQGQTGLVPQENATRAQQAGYILVQ